MGKMEFYVIWSVKDPPVQLNRKCSPVTYHTFLPSPLPEQLVVFGLGDWKSSCGTTVLAEVCVNSDVKPQKIGSLSPEVRCLVWDGEWRVDILLAVLKQAEQGVQAQLVLTASGQDKKVGFTSTPSKNCFWAEPMKLPLHVDNISPLLPSDTISEDLESPDLIRDEHVKGQYSQPEVNEQINFTRSSPPSKKLYISVNGGDSIQAIKIKKFQEEEEIIHHSPAGTELVLTREKLIKAKSRLSQRFEGNGIPLKGLEDECGTWFSRRFAVQFPSVIHSGKTEPEILEFELAFDIEEELDILKVVVIAAILALTNKSPAIDGLN
ncbi:uncharacterized protein LOC122803798 [Protopterus annectens]|uniref:uncharacterized protein LOC122803798 n=1 Tax=Protopterus annectens TaxID=7888 RepID=UPI001CFAC875|nr:uncharacterized protein LOC122803798 [Protopterus annectens]